MVEVYHGRDVRMGRDTAIKVLRSDHARDPNFLKRFEREARSAAHLHHPAIVHVFDMGEGVINGSTLPYMVMEFIEGRTLREALQREGPFDERRAMEITSDICAALDHSHSRGIFHRGIRPAKVMLAPDGGVKIIGFGSTISVTMAGARGVPSIAPYISPEQACGGRSDARSDVYSVGALFHELITGEPPFRGDSPVAVAYQHVRKIPGPPSRLNPRVSAAADAITLKALENEPDDRYSTAGAMRDDLEAALVGRRVGAQTTGARPLADGSMTGAQIAGSPGSGYGNEYEPGSNAYQYARPDWGETNDTYEFDHLADAVEQDDHGGPLRAESVLDRRYRLIGVLSSHGPVTLWRGDDTVLTRPVAVLVVEHVHDDPARRKAGHSLLAAAVASGRLVHPGAASTYDASVTDTENGEVSYVITEWADGRTLRQLTQEGPLRPEQAAAVVLGAARVIAAAHERGLRHGGLRPSDVIVSIDGIVKVIDLEIGAVLASLDGTGPASVSGPEVQAADVRALGGLLYATLTGRWPLPGDAGLPPAPYGTFGRLQSPRQLNHEVPRDLDAATIAALGGEEAGTEPITTAAELISELEAALDYRPRRAQTIRRPQAPWRAADGHPGSAGW